MKQGIVKFSKEFVTETGLKEWVGVELPFDADSQSAGNILRVAETLVNEYQRNKSYIMQYNMPCQAKEDMPPDYVNAPVTVSAILSCGSLEDLHREYKYRVRGNDLLVEAYQKREKELIGNSYESLDDNK